MAYPKQADINQHHLYNTTVHIMYCSDGVCRSVNKGKTKNLLLFNNWMFNEYYINNPLLFNKYKGKKADKPKMPNVLWKDVITYHNDFTISFPEKYIWDFITVMCLAGLEVDTIYEEEVLQ